MTHYSSYFTKRQQYHTMIQMYIVKSNFFFKLEIKKSSILWPLAKEIISNDEIYFLPTDYRHFLVSNLLKLAEDDAKL